VALLFIDLDRFKAINDTLGHAAGDTLLTITADRIVAQLRDSDVAARVGGDEFAVLVPDLPFDGDPIQAVAAAERAAQRIQEHLRGPVILQRREIYASTSIGISAFPVDADDAASLVRNADAAMYQAKRTDPGSYVVFSGRAGPMRDTLALANRLRQAARERRWALEYQPIVDLEQGGVVAVEALLRLKRSGGRLLPACEFIQMAEEMGLMGPVTDWVVERLCEQIPVWRRGGSCFDVAFNLSARQLWDPSLPETILGRLERGGIDPRWVTVEVTESAVMTQVDRAKGVLRALHDGGIRLAIDDFGTGYSSLSRLRELPVDVVKIDRSFVRDLPGDRDARAIVRAMLQLATNLEIVPLAEGIETDAQLAFLTEQGCALGQGYLFARPMGADEAHGFAERQPRAV
jgi:diguanylate cyclase (GGDEF)-like protein